MAGRRLQVIPAAGPHDHMPLTMDLVTKGMRHSPDPTRGRWDHEKIEEMLSDPVARLTFFKLELGPARRLTGSSDDQSLVETAKTEITRVEKQMRRFSRELEEGTRKQDAFTVYRYARLLAGTGIGSKHSRFGQIRAYTPSQIEWAHGLAKEGPKGGLALHEYTWTDFRREHLELLDPGESEATATQIEH